MCIMKAWQLARLILPSLSSRAPDKTHLPAPQQDHGILLDRRRTPRVFRWGFSSILVFASFRRTPRNSRDGLASPAIMCECAMEPIGPVWPQVAAICWHLPAQPPLLRSRTRKASACAGCKQWAACEERLAYGSCPGQTGPDGLHRTLTPHCR